MAHLKTTYIEGDLFVQNSIKVSEYKTLDGTILATVEGIDKNLDENLDDFSGKIAVFRDNKGQITKAPISIDEGTYHNSDNEKVDDEATAQKILYELLLDDRRENKDKTLDLGVMLSNISSKDFVINSSQIHLHDGDSPCWKFTKPLEELEGSTEITE